MGLVAQLVVVLAHRLALGLPVVEDRHLLALKHIQALLVELGMVGVVLVEVVEAAPLTDPVELVDRMAALLQPHPLFSIMVLEAVVVLLMPLEQRVLMVFA